MVSAVAEVATEVEVLTVTTVATEQTAFSPAVVDSEEPAVSAIALEEAGPSVATLGEVEVAAGEGDWDVSEEGSVAAAAAAWVASAD